MVARPCWSSPDPTGGERGVRVELRKTAHRGTRSAAQEVWVDQPLWRADLFDVIDGPPANLARAHFHPNFEGVEPSDRCWDEQLSRDPFGWLAEQLCDLVVTSGATGDEDWLAADAAELARNVPTIVEAATNALAEARDRFV